jgi:hypothetical protein
LNGSEVLYETIEQPAGRIRGFTSPVADEDSTG